MPNSTPLGSPMPSICFQTAGRGLQALGSNRRKEPTLRKYAVSHTSPTTIATSEAMAAPATPSGWPVPQPKMRNGARIMLRMTVTVPTTMPVLKLPMARRAALIATRPNCSAMAGTNQARYCVELGGARVRGHAPGVGQARRQTDHQEQNARKHRQHLRLVEQHDRLGCVFPADGV